MFKGRHDLLMDNKGRVSIPTRYREVLQEQQDRHLVLTNFNTNKHKYLLAFPQNEWLQVEANLAAQAKLGSKYRHFQRYLVTVAEECPLDRQGRILVPPPLREYAEITREVVLGGMTRYIELWDKQAFLAHRQELESQDWEEEFQGLF
jgi:MraZ protein